MRQALELALKFVEDSECGTADLEAHIKEALAQPERDYERGFIDGMQKQMQSSVDKAVNRMAQPEQEPVAYINIEERKLEWAYKYMSWDTPTVVNLPKIPLYTTPPQRTWVGLTEEERGICINANMGTGLWAMAKDIEAKLKEKNNG